MTPCSNILRFLGIIAFFLLAGTALHAQPGTVRKVQTFTYGSPQEGYFVLPPRARYEKILMHYRLRCPFDGPCGEWDYLMYIHLYDHTGVMDSTRDTAVSFRVGGQAPDSLGFMRTPSWRYIPFLQRTRTYTDTTKLQTFGVGTETGTIQLPKEPYRAQYLWRASELAEVGMEQGEITGLQFNVVTASRFRRFTIRMKEVTRDTLGGGGGGFETVGLKTVYESDHSFENAGWSTVRLTDPFLWNGTSSLVIDISYDSLESPMSAMQSSQTSFFSGVAATAQNRYLHFEGPDYVEVPKGAFETIDSAITIAFWQYGNPPYQPQEQSIFEGADRFGRRALNVHLPWADRQLYWDAGSGTYDRLIKPIDSSIFAGRWNHWVVVKNARTGLMKIYLNGGFWASTTGKRKLMNGIERFRIGSFADGSRSYDGDIDEFAIWDTEVDQVTIRNWAGRDLAASHPFASNLRLYYKFNDGSLTTAFDSSGHGYHGTLVGPPASRRVRAADIFSNVAATKTRPNIIFEQGVFTSTVSTAFRLDSVETDPIQIVRYGSSSNPGAPTDTTVVWPSYSREVYNAQGQLTGTVPVAPDSMLRQTRTPYFRKFEKVERYEIGRYITPYGNGLSLGEGFTWTYDVTDYATLLHDSVHLAAYNQQELVDLSFEFIEGTPPRDPLSVRNLWVGTPGYGTAKSIEEFLTPKRVWIDPAAVNSRLKLRTTGHGFGGNENCAEFCPKHHMIDVNGQTRFDTVVWKEDCGLNPVYPQGGTWVYNRSNWCPGDDVPTYDLELTPFVTPGDSVTLDYNVEPYTWNGQGTTPTYVIETQLVGYSAPNFPLDAAIEHIKSPSRTDDFRRMNPICGNPIITIRNTGSTPLTALTITYGVEGGTQSTYQWSGNLGFMETEDVRLGTFSWTGNSSNTFRVALSSPNGAADGYARNDTMSSLFDFPPEYPTKLIFEMTTNNSSTENAYEVRNAEGAVVHERRNLLPGTAYRDTVTLPAGCYEFRLTDAGGDGLDWWANPNAGKGTMRIRNGTTGVIVRTFNPDFGSEIYQQFTVGFKLSGVADEVAPADDQVSIYPNPANDELNVQLRFGQARDVAIVVRDLNGRAVRTMSAKEVTSDVVAVDLDGIASGLYVVTVETAWGATSRKVVIAR